MTSMVYGTAERLRWSLDVYRMVVALYLFCQMVEILCGMF